MIFYLIRGNQLTAELEADPTDVVALSLPLFGGGDAISLLNSQHAQALMSNLGLSASEALDALGLVDLRSTMLKSIVVGPDPAGHSHVVGGVVAYHLASIGTYSLWQCDGQRDDLLALHNRLWAMEPAGTLGLLAIVEMLGDAFYDSAVRAATGMTVPQALARRDRVATYLESLGYNNTDSLRTATTEHTQMVGIAEALGHSEAQLWGAMR
mgnify:CR=1 FL=1